MTKFKFLTDNDEDEFEGFVNDLEYGLASWMWANQDNVDLHWREEEMLTMSIRTFLRSFPEHMIVPVLSISSGGITITSINNNEPWPFDVSGQNELTFRFLMWIP